MRPVRDVNRGPAEVGYIVMGYPRLSESFISNEILQLERLGTRVRVYAVKPGGEDRVHDSVKSIVAPVSYLPRMTSLSGTSLLPWLRANLSAYRAAHGRLMRAAPLRYLGVLASAVAIATTSSGTSCCTSSTSPPGWARPSQRAAIPPMRNAGWN